MVPWVHVQKLHGKCIIETTVHRLTIFFFVPDSSLHFRELLLNLILSKDLYY